MAIDLPPSPRWRDRAFDRQFDGAPKHSSQIHARGRSESYVGHGQLGAFDVFIASVAREKEPESWLNRSILGQRLAEHFLDPFDVKTKILHALDHVKGFFIAHHLLILRCAFAAERTSLDRLVKRCGREQAI